MDFRLVNCTVYPEKECTSFKPRKRNEFRHCTLKYRNGYLPRFVFETDRTARALPGAIGRNLRQGPAGSQLLCLDREKLIFQCWF